MAISALLQNVSHQVIRYRSSPNKFKRDVLSKIINLGNLILCCLGWASKVLSAPFNSNKIFNKTRIKRKTYEHAISFFLKHLNTPGTCVLELSRLGLIRFTFTSVAANVAWSVYYQQGDRACHIF